MSPSDRDYDELVRRALQVAAGSVEPADDGLERIRARLATPYPVPVAWLMAGYSEAARRTQDGLQCVPAWLRISPGPVLEHFQAALPGRLRSAAVLAIAALVAAAGILMLTPLPRQAITHAAAILLPFDRGGSSGGAGRPGVSGHGTRLSPVGTGVTASGPGKGSPSHPATASCAAPAPTRPATSPTLGRAPSLAPSASPGASAKSPACRGPVRSATPSATPPASPAPSATPSATPPASPAPSATPSATPPPSPAPSATPSTTPPPSPAPSTTSASRPASPAPSSSP